MAAFPLPPLALYVPEPLRGLFAPCEIEWAFPVRGRRFTLIPDAGILRVGLARDREAGAEALRQFEVLLARIRRHRGAIVADEVDGCFGDSWQTPHDCLTHFNDWRRAFTEALRAMGEPTFFDPRWMTETVVALRDAIVAAKAFDRLPILADALEEAGCDNREILDHLRANDEHGHHCWVLDLLDDGRSGGPT